MITNKPEICILGTFPSHTGVKNIVHKYTSKKNYKEP